MEPLPLLHLSRDNFPKQSVKLLQFGGPVCEFDIWEKPPVPTTSDIIRSRRVPKVAKEEAQCQANIQIDPLSDLVKKEVRETQRVSMAFAEVVDVCEDDYRFHAETANSDLSSRASNRVFDGSRFNTKAEFEFMTRVRDDALSHFKETWEFQQKYMKERLAACQKTASSLRKGMEDTKNDFLSLGVTQIPKTNTEEESRKREEEDRIKLQQSTDKLLSRNRELLGEVDALLARRETKPTDSASVQAPIPPPKSASQYTTSLALTKRMTTAFETASKAVSISTRSKSLSKPKRLLYNSRKK